MKTSFKVEGFREMEKALAQLPRGTAKGVTRRVLKKTLAPVQDVADAFSPHFQIVVTSRLESGQRRSARSDFGQAVVSMYVGPVSQDGSPAPHASLVEFGTGPRFQKSTLRYTGIMPPDPFMRPAWDINKGTMLKRLGELMWVEIEKSVARAARKAEREAAKV